MSLLLSLLFLSFATSPSFAKTCTVPHGNGDDSPAIMKAFQDCKTDSTIVFSKGVKYNAWSPMSWSGLKNVAIQLDGSLCLPNNIGEVQAKVRSNKNPGSSNKPWFYIDGTNVSLTGAGGDDPNSGSFQSYGQQWWAIKQQTNRPRLLTFHVTNGKISYIKVIKPIAWGFSISGSNVKVINHYVDAAPDGATPGQTTSFPSNTDGIAIGGSNVTVDGYYGNNGDDCINITNGGRNIVAKNGYCGFASHGLSVGSLGQDGSTASVSNVLFQSWTMDNAVNAVRFKSWPGGKGQAENVTWKDIKVNNVTAAILITQEYCDHEKGCSSSSGGSTKIKDFKFENISGSLANHKVNGKQTTDSIVLNLYAGYATGLSFNNIKISPFNLDANHATVVCDPSVFSGQDLDNLGFKCEDGYYYET